MRYVLSRVASATTSPRAPGGSARQWLVWTDGQAAPLPPVTVGARVLVSGGYGDPIAAVVTEVAGERLTYRLDDGREQRGHLDDVARVLAAVGADSAPTTTIPTATGSTLA